MYENGYLYQASAVVENAFESACFTIYYWLVETLNADNTPSTECEKTYSILAVKHDQGDCEQSFVYDVTRNFLTAKIILEMLTSGSVTPCMLPDVIYDIISSGI